MDEATVMVGHAQAYLDAARDNLRRSGREMVAFDEARHAAEVAGKVLFLRKMGHSMGKVHAIAGKLAREGLIPRSVDMRRLSNLLARHTRGAYGFFENISLREVEEAIAMAESMVQAAR